MKTKCHWICTKFAEGCGGTVASTNQAWLSPGAAFFYGWTNHTIALIRQCREQGREWYYCDNGYHFGYGTHYRVTRGALTHDGSGNAGPARFKSFGLAVKRWPRGGSHIVLTTQSEMFYRDHLRTTRAAWTEQTIEELRRYTKRGIKVLDKPVGSDLRRGVNRHNLDALIRDAWTLVACSSATMVKALMEGVPVFSLKQSMASNMGLSDLSQIESPYRPPDREQWLWNLAANQWTMNEFIDGTCWRDLQKMTKEEK